MSVRIIFLITVFLLLICQTGNSADINVTVQVIVPIGTSSDFVNISTNQTTIVNASDSNTTLELTASENASGTIDTLLTSIPVDIPSLGVPSLDKYLKIDADEQITENLDYVLIKLFYSDDELSASGLEEGSLNLYWWNQTTSSWEKLDTSMDWIYGTGVDTVDNYVWANLTHFSVYGAGGNSVPPLLSIKREYSSLVRSNEKFETTLYLENHADFELFNIEVREKIPSGYQIRGNQRIIPEPVFVEEENDYTIIHWKIDRLSGHKNFTMKYTIFAPKPSDNYTLKADTFGFDKFNDKYAAYNETTQRVLSPPTWIRILRFLGLFK